MRGSAAAATAAGRGDTSQWLLRSGGAPTALLLRAAAGPPPSSSSSSSSSHFLCPMPLTEGPGRSWCRLLVNLTFGFLIISHPRSHQAGTEVKKPAAESKRRKHGLGGSGIQMESVLIQYQSPGSFFGSSSSRRVQEPRKCLKKRSTPGTHRTAETMVDIILKF